MTPMDAFRQAVAQLGDAPAEQLSLFIEQTYGVRIEPKYIPFFRASLHDLERLTRQRQERKTAAGPSTVPSPAA